MSEKVRELRRLMKDYGIQAYFVPSSDPHQSEYVPEFWQRRKFISGFTGSAGDVVITKTKAGLWTDSRYFLQAEQQLDSRVFTLFKIGLPGVPTWKEWLLKELKSGEALGFDPKLITHKDFSSLKKEFESKGILLKSIEKNLVDAVWEQRPEPPLNKIVIHPIKYAGESAASKLGRLREKMAAEQAVAHVLTLLDAIAWLFNIRGSDVKYNPVAISYAIVTAKKAMLFIDLNKVSAEVRKILKEESVEVHNYSDFGPALRQLAKGKKRVWLDEGTVSQWVVNTLKRGAHLTFKPSPIALFKAIKNEAELSGFEAAHIRDGVAMVKFLSWLEGALGKSEVTEISAAKRVAEFQALDPLFRGQSFETISSYGSHGAIVHYASTPETDIPLKREGIYLIDAGGQYQDATTDMTRTVSLGEPTEEQKENFTRILKGVIGLTLTSFPQGTSGKQLDSIARLALWEKGLNFGHGVGHGVGSYLNVHEGPQAISYYRCIGVGLEPGMITSIEPGYYKENEYGMRVENMAVVVKDEEKSSAGLTFYKFETLTLCPIDTRLVKKELLTQAEIKWLNDYHRRVREKLTPYLNELETGWLLKATTPL